MNNIIIYIILIYLEIISFNKIDTLDIKIFDNVLFEKSINYAVKYNDDDIKSMIVPHHLLVSDKISNMYLTASSDAVKSILLISPDHFCNSDKEVITSKKNWLGSFGLVKSDNEFIDKLLKLDFIYEDDIEIESEHGLNSQIPYISYYFKNAKVTPLAISKETTINQLNQIIELIDSDMMVIASVDFSHYYSLEKANEFDETTKKLILNKEYNEFFKLDDAYFDSPSALYIIFNNSKKYGLETVILDHSNSSYYSSEKIFKTTSYYFISFIK